MENFHFTNHSLKTDFQLKNVTYLDDAVRTLSLGQEDEALDIGIDDYAKDDGSEAA